MEKETEELLQKWLKIQIWKHKISVVVWVLIILSLFAGSWATYFYILPPFKQQLENTQSMLKQMSTTSEDLKEKEALFEKLFKR